MRGSRPGVGDTGGLGPLPPWRKVPWPLPVCPPCVGAMCQGRWEGTPARDSASNSGQACMGSRAFPMEPGASKSLPLFLRKWC